MRTLRVTLEINVDDLPAETRQGFARDAEMQVDELPMLADHTADEIASVLDGVGTEGASEMLFEGSDIFVQFAGARVLAAAWADDEDRAALAQP